MSCFQPHHPIKLLQPSSRRTISQLLAGGGRPTDIAACSDTSRLYVAIIDVHGGIIVTIQLGEKPGITKECRSGCLLTTYASRDD